MEVNSRYEQVQRTSREFQSVEEYQPVQNVPTTYRSAIGSRVLNLSGQAMRFPKSLIAMCRVMDGPSSSGGYKQGNRSKLSTIVDADNSIGINRVSVINSARERDKRDLMHLNDKFAQYVEKLRFLEAQNRKLRQDIEALESRSLKTPSQIKDMYDVEFREAQKLFENLSHESDAIRRRRQNNEVELLNLEAQKEQIARAQRIDGKQIDDIRKKIAENEAQIALYRRRLTDIEDEIQSYRDENRSLASQLNRLQDDIQMENLLKSTCLGEKAQAENQLTILKQTYEAELNEIRSRNISKDLDPSKFFRNELASAIREIRDEYENSLDNYRQSLDLDYTLLKQKHAAPLALPPLALPAAQTRPAQVLREKLVTVQSEKAHLTADNQGLEYTLSDFQRKLKEIHEQNEEVRRNRMKDIEKLRRDQDEINQKFEAVTTLQTTLQKEIAEYRELLEGENGLRPVADRIGSRLGSQYIRRSATNLASSTPPSTAQTSQSRQATIRDTSGSRLSTQSNYTRTGSMPRPASTDPGNGSNIYQRITIDSIKQDPKDNPSNYMPRDSPANLVYQNEDNQYSYVVETPTMSQRRSVPRSSLRERSDRASLSDSQSHTENDYTEAEQYSRISTS